MTDYISFEAEIIAMEWGTSVYTVLPLPDEVVDALGRAIRVEGEIADHPVNLALTKAPVLKQHFLYTGRALLREIGIEPGQRITVRLRAADETLVEVPADVGLALKTEDLSAVWNALTPGKRRGLLYQVSTAKRAATRESRIQKLLAELHSLPK